MATITAATLRTLTNNPNIALADCEEIIDHAIDKINLAGQKYDLSLNNMTGTAGSKTLNVTSAEKGAIMEVAIAVYSGNYSSSSSTSISIGPLSSSGGSATSVSRGGESVETLAENAAKQLSEITVEYG